MNTTTPITMAAFGLLLTACEASTPSAPPTSFRMADECNQGEQDCVCMLMPGGTETEGSSGSSAGGSVSTDDGTTAAAGTTADPSSSGPTSDSSDSGGGSSSESTGGDPPTGPVIPAPPAACPTITDGRVAFEVNGTTREVFFANVSGAGPTGPLAFVWHGTFGVPENWYAWHWATMRITDMVEQEGGLLAMPVADPDAVARPTSFPWWMGDWDCALNDGTNNTYDAQCDRTDDDDLMDYAVACVIEQNLADPYWISTSGSSAGGIISSHLATTKQYLAAAVPSAGGLDFAPAEAANPEIGVMNMHGGVDDVYCDATDCYSFQAPVEDFAMQLAGSNGCDPNAVVPAEGCPWVFLCESPWAGDGTTVCPEDGTPCVGPGHTWQMGEESAEFLRGSRWGDPAWIGHVWTHSGQGPQTDPPLPFWRGELNGNCYRVYEPTPFPTF